MPNILGSGEILEGLGLGPLFWEHPNPKALPYTFQMRSLGLIELVSMHYCV
jgi:hypothetical protein